MKVLNKQIRFNESFQPQLVLTIAFPLEVVKDESEVLTGEQFLEELNKAIDEYEKDTRAMKYTAPLASTLFLLRHVLGFENENTEAILIEAAKLCEDVIAPTNQDGDKVGCKFET
jgi:hypothetical protein